MYVQKSVPQSRHVETLFEAAVIILSFLWDQKEERDGDRGREGGGSECITVGTVGVLLSCPASAVFAVVPT